MGHLLMREPLPDRRRSWTQHVHIEGHSVYMTVGEYADGRPGELFIDVAKEGTFLRGVMGTLARTISIALQCGADVGMIVHSLKGLDYPPSGMVQGSTDVQECYSVTDWIAQELEARYLLMRPATALEGVNGPSPDLSGENGTQAIVERSVGHVSEEWRTGA